MWDFSYKVEPSLFDLLTMTFHGQIFTLTKLDLERSLQVGQISLAQPFGKNPQFLFAALCRKNNERRQRVYLERHAQQNIHRIKVITVYLCKQLTWSQGNYLDSIYVLLRFATHAVQGISSTFFQEVRSIMCFPCALPYSMNVRVIQTASV